MKGAGGIVEKLLTYLFYGETDLFRVRYFKKSGVRCTGSWCGLIQDFEPICVNQFFPISFAAADGMKRRNKKKSLSPHILGYKL